MKNIYLSALFITTQILQCSQRVWIITENGQPDYIVVPKEHFIVLPKKIYNKEANNLKTLPIEIDEFKQRREITNKYFDEFINIQQQHIKLLSKKLQQFSQKGSNQKNLASQEKNNLHTQTGQ